MTTKVKQAKMVWSPDEPGTLWGYPLGADSSGLTVSYFIHKCQPGYQAIVAAPQLTDNEIVGNYKILKEAKAACAVDALKYL